MQYYLLFTYLTLYLKTKFVLLAVLLFALCKTEQLRQSLQYLPIHDILYTNLHAVISTNN